MPHKRHRQPLVLQASGDARLLDVCLPSYRKKTATKKKKRYDDKKKTAPKNHGTKKEQDLSRKAQHIQKTEFQPIAPRLFPCSFALFKLATLLRPLLLPSPFFWTAKQHGTGQERQGTGQESLVFRRFFLLGPSYASWRDACSPILRPQCPTRQSPKIRATNMLHGLTRVPWHRWALQSFASKRAYGPSPAFPEGREDQRKHFFRWLILKAGSSKTFFF